LARSGCCCSGSSPCCSWPPGMSLTRLSCCRSRGGRRIPMIGVCSVDRWWLLWMSLCGRLARGRMLMLMMMRWLWWRSRRILCHGTVVVWVWNDSPARRSDLDSHIRLLSLDFFNLTLFGSVVLGKATFLNG
jgi:hypothetical protein